MNILQIRQSYRGARRLRHIVAVLIKHGFGRVVEQLTLQRYIPFKKRVQTFGHWTPDRHLTDAERIRMAFEELGPSFIKLAQLLSARPDLITETFANEFKKLQDEVPPFPVADVRRIIEDEVRMPVDDIFAEFNDTPLAAASIAQVHRGVLQDGSEVVVKVQRPGIRETIETDIHLLRTIAKLMIRYIPEAVFFNPVGIVNEFARTVRKEMDFVEEGRNACRFRRNFADNLGIFIPRIYAEFMTEKVLVMEYIDGVRIDDMNGIERLGLNRRELADIGVGAYFKQILEDGFFHADPHPGNIIAMPSGMVAFLDFGLVGRINERFRESIANLLMALLDKNFDAVVDEYIELGIVPEELDLERFRREFTSDLEEFMEPLYGLTLNEIDFAAYLNTLTELAMRHHLRMPDDLLLVNKTMLVLENIGRSLDPNFDFIAAAKPFASKIMKRRMDPSRLCRTTSKHAKELGEFALFFPKQVRTLIQRTLRDQLTIRMHHVGIDHLIKDFDRSSNRIAFSLIVSALLLSSAIMHSTNVGPKIYGLSALAMISFLVAFLMGIWLLISIIKSGRL